MAHKPPSHHPHPSRPGQLPKQLAIVILGWLTFFVVLVIFEITKGS